MTLIRLVLACLALSIAAPASAQEEGIATIQLKPSACTATKSRPATVGALVAAPETFNRKCVRIMGVAAGLVLYDDRADYELARADRAAPVARIGLYGNPALLDALPQDPTPTEIVGQVALCGGGPFVAGYCHDVADGVILIATEARPPNPAVD
jgi:hypothetical protein